jgi:hypothetical protein
MLFILGCEALGRSATAFLIHLILLLSTESAEEPIVKTPKLQLLRCKLLSGVCPIPFRFSDSAPSGVPGEQVECLLLLASPALEVAD